MFHVKHSFSEAETPEQAVEDILDPGATGQLVERCPGRAQSIRENGEIVRAGNMLQCSIGFAEAFGLCEDEAVIGTPFYVMEMVDGHGMVLSLMASALLASLLSRLLSPPLYGALAELQLQRLPAAR